ncbi:MAG: NfeD family protein [Actinomycetota bacterium]
MSLVIAVVIAVMFLEPLWGVLLVVAALLFESLEIWLFLYLRKMRATTGQEAMVGTTGRTTSRCDPEGQAWVKGALWTVTAEEDLDRNTQIEVTAVDGLHLRVRALENALEAPVSRSL